MPLLIGTKRGLLRGRQTYTEKVLSYGPIAYWPLAEKSGTVGYDQVASAQNGTYARDVATMGTGVGIGDGNTAPDFDGTNDYCDIYTATFIGRFDGAEGTLALWAKVSGAGVWTDGAGRRPIQLRVDAANRIYIDKAAVNNTIDFLYQAGGTVETVTINPITDLTWMCFALTWSKSAGASGEVKAYYNGAQTGATQVGLGVWAGALAASATSLGAGGTGPFNPFDGYVAHGAIWDRPLAPVEIAALAIV